MPLKPPLKCLKDFQYKSEAFKNLSALYVAHFPAKADRVIALARKAQERSPGDPNILDALGWAYYKKGDLKKAIVYFKKALSVRPYFLYHAGIVSLKAGDEKNGKAYLRELVRKYPDHEMSKTLTIITEK